ncbi:PiggyBac transposable element-derived protein 4, partial [Cucumispora dikerogammari]
MSYKRYTEINTNISINSMNKNVASEKRNVDESVSKILQYVNKVSQSVFYSSVILSINEGVCKFQKGYSFKTYMPAKPIKVGIKYYILADAKTSFICNIKLYTGVYQSI